jgi:hypothetical protein
MRLVLLKIWFWVATDIGIGSLYLWGILSAFNADKELLNDLSLPEGFIPASCIVH